MTPGAVGKRYARAVYDLAAEAGQVSEVGEGLTVLAEALNEAGPESVASGLLSRDQRVALGKALAASLGEESLLARMIGVIAERDRLESIPAVAAAYRSMEDAAAGRVRVQVTSAAAMSDEELDRIREAFRGIAGKEVLAELTVDESLIGGAVVAMEGRVFDGSVRSRLERLERAMAEGG